MFTKQTIIEALKTFPDDALFVLRDQRNDDIVHRVQQFTHAIFEEVDGSEHACCVVDTCEVFTRNIPERFCRLDSTRMDRKI